MSPRLSTPLFDPPRRMSRASPGLRWVRWLLCLLLGALFLIAGVIKVINLRKFEVAIESYEFTWLVDPLPGLTAMFLPWLEIFCGLALLCRLPGWRRLYEGALVTLAVSSLLFLGAVISRCARGIEVGCGCFGDITLSCPTHILLNSILALSSIWLLLTDRVQSPREGAVSVISRA